MGIESVPFNADENARPGDHKPVDEGVVDEAPFSVEFNDKGVQYKIVYSNAPSLSATRYELVFPRLNGRADFSNGTLFLGYDRTRVEKLHRFLTIDIYQALDGSDEKAYALAKRLQELM